MAFPSTAAELLPSCCAKVLAVAVLVDGKATCSQADALNPVPLLQL